MLAEMCPRLPDPISAHLLVATCVRDKRELHRLQMIMGPAFGVVVQGNYTGIVFAQGTSKLVPLADAFIVVNIIMFATPGVV